MCTAIPRRIFCRPCLDWSERRYHIAGQVGAAAIPPAFGIWVDHFTFPLVGVYTLPQWLGIGLSVNNARAVVEALMGHSSGFTRTPKLGGEGRLDRLFNRVAELEGRDVRRTSEVSRTQEGQK